MKSFFAMAVLSSALTFFAFGCVNSTEVETGQADEENLEETSQAATVYKSYYLHNPDGNSNHVKVTIYHRDPWSLNVDVVSPSGTTKNCSRDSAGMVCQISLPYCSTWRNNTAVHVSVRYNDVYGAPSVYYNFNDC